MSDEDILAISEDDLNASQNTSLCQTANHKFAVHILNIFQYSYEDIYLTLVQIVDRLYLVRNKAKKHSKDLAKAMLFQGYYFGLGLMTMMFSAELNSITLAILSPFSKTEGRKVVKSLVVFLWLRCCHRHNSVQMLREEGSHPSPNGHFRVNLITRPDGAKILQAEAVKLSKVANTLQALVRKRLLLWT